MSHIDKNTFIKNDYFKISKFIECLSVCNKLQDLMMMSLIKKHEKNNILCSKYFYLINLKFKKNNTKYDINKISISFLDNTNLYQNNFISDALKYMKSPYPISYNTDAKKYDFYEPYYSSFYKIVTIFDNSNKYKFLFLPIIVDYSMDVGLVHQCGLIVDFQNSMFLFYEPYGLYNKYSAEYHTAIKEFLELYKWPSKYYNNGILKYNTWHTYFELNHGIQYILIQEHNKKKDQFDNDLNNYLTNLSNNNQYEYNTLKKTIDREKNLPVHKDDYTFNTLYLASHFNNNKFSDEFEVDAFYIYYKYNSKTCVAITITELDYFFTEVYKYPLIEQKKILNKYYSQFQNTLNDKLFGRTLEFIKSLKNPNYLLDILDNSMADICKKIK